MARYVLAAVLALCLSAPTLAAKRHYNGAPSERCKIVNIAPYYNKTTVRKGRRVYLTRSTAPVNMAIICKH